MTSWPCEECTDRAAKFVLEGTGYCEPCLTNTLEGRIRYLDGIRRSLPEIFQEAALRAQVPYMLTLDELRAAGVLPEEEHEGLVR